jgi:polysaccharide export outer membrane protein
MNNLVDRESAPASKYNVLLYVMVILILMFMSGCIRYTPSREELQEKYGKEDKEKLLNLGGEEEFNAYETMLKTRLKNLMAQRAHLLTPGPNGGAYTVGPGDVMHLSIFGFEDMSSDAEVSALGSVSLPLVGEYFVSGKDLSTINRELTEQYSRYIRSPNVQVGMKNYEANHVSVIGEVAKPGVYPLKRQGQLLTELLSEAGGKTQLASNRIILLSGQRGGGGRAAIGDSTVGTSPTLTMASAHVEQPQAMGIEIELDDLLGHVNQQPILVPLMSGDMIIVPEAGTYEVDGEIEKPGSYKLASRTSAMGAIAAAGGFTYAANVNKVEVIRDMGAGRKALVTMDLEEVGLRGGSDVRLRNGDLVRVPSEPARFFRRQVVTALNSVFNGFTVNRRVP